MYLIRAGAGAEKAVPDLVVGIQGLNKIRAFANVPVIPSVADKNELVDKIL